MLDPIVKTIEVPCSQETAFNVFIKEMDSWWPFESFSQSVMRGQKVNSLRVDARQGGQIVEVSSDDTEVPWGTITTFEPHDFLGMDFHLQHPSEEKRSDSQIEIRFTVLADDRTRVELTQSNWEAFGDMAEMVHGGYGTAWGVIFEQAFRKACGG